MSKSVLISIRPNWCVLIASGKKTIEVRKTAPKIETPFKCYIYCTNSGRPLVYGDMPCADGWTEAYTQTYGYSREEADKIWGVMNGKVIGEFVCDRVIAWNYIPDPDESSDPGSMAYDVLTVDGEKTGMEYDDFEEYGKGAPLFGWHISELVIYDEPKKLGEFMKEPCDFAASCGAYVHGVPVDCEVSVQRPPQSWCYVEELP